MNRSTFKYFGFLAISTAMFFSSCKKDVDDTPGSIVGKYEQRVLFEEFRAEWCGICGKAAPKFNEIVEKYGNQVMCVGMHYTDQFEVKYPPTTSYFFDFFDLNGVPSVLVNKKYDQTKEWIVQVEKYMGYKANAGIKLNTEITGNILDVEVVCTSEIDRSNALLSVYIVEDNVPESSPGAQSGGGGKFIHRNMLREILTSKAGDPVNIKAGTEETIKFKVNNLAKYKKSDLYVMAFLLEESSKSHEYINGNFVKAGQDSDW
ncbi:MAG: Omp28-related outer membrane protein [Deltaproteobacteria bacterium]